MIVLLSTAQGLPLGQVGGSLCFVSFLLLLRQCPTCGAGSTNFDQYKSMYCVPLPFPPPLPVCLRLLLIVVPRALEDAGSVCKVGVPMCAAHNCTHHIPSLAVYLYVTLLGHERPRGSGVSVGASQVRAARGTGAGV